MSRDPCAPIIRGAYRARRARHVRHGWAAFAAASTGAVACGGASATAVWLNNQPVASAGSADWTAWAGLQRFTSQIGTTAAATPTPADWAAWARLQESNSGVVVPQPGTPGWAAFVATHRGPALGTVQPDAAPAPVHVPEPASVAIMGVALLAAGVVSWWRR